MKERAPPWSQRMSRGRPGEHDEECPAVRSKPAAGDSSGLRGCKPTFQSGGSSVHRHPAVASADHFCGYQLRRSANLYLLNEFAGCREIFQVFENSHEGRLGEREWGSELSKSRFWCFGAMVVQVRPSTFLIRVSSPMVLPSIQ